MAFDRRAYNKKYRENNEGLHQKQLAYWKEYREKNAEALKEKRKEYRKKKGKVFSDGVRRSRVKKAYGLTLEDYDALKTKPCEICNEVKLKMCIDHTFEGSYHGVLCHSCNAALGLLGHDAARLERAASYVRRTRSSLSHPGNSSVSRGRSRT